MQETTVEDGIKFRFTDEQGVGRAPAVQGRTLAVGVAEVSFSAVRWISEQSMPSRA